MTTSEVIQLIERFVTAADTSPEAANVIEVALEDAFPEDDYLQQTVEMLAMYRPGGGDFLFDEDAIKRRLAKAIEYLKNK